MNATKAIRRWTSRNAVGQRLATCMAGRRGPGARRAPGWGGRRRPAQPQPLLGRAAGGAAALGAALACDARDDIQHQRRHSRCVSCDRAALRRAALLLQISHPPGRISDFRRWTPRAATPDVHRARRRRSRPAAARKRRSDRPRGHWQRRCWRRCFRGLRRPGGRLGSDCRHRRDRGCRHPGGQLCLGDGRRRVPCNGGTMLSTTCEHVVRLHRGNLCGRLDRTFNGHSLAARAADIGPGPVARNCTLGKPGWSG
mmetsp:Transcript_90739/g.292909  ORF Transcript_90739/g.292909 Transcript_90739/m.292909 type:complete len:255 (+) Transcript_90739:668-1432(+)